MFRAGPGPIWIAHRGVSARAPENTLPAFALALDQGIECIELDYHESADGVPIVIHDETVDRTTNGIEIFGRNNVRVDSLTAKDLQKLDAGNWGKWANGPFRGAGLPLLEQALRRIVPYGVCMIERKAGSPARLSEILYRLDCVERVTVASFDWEILLACRETCPGLSLGALGEGVLSPSVLESARELGAQWLGWEQGFLTQVEVQRARASNLPVWAWTVDNPERAKKLLEMGVTGIISNDPAATRRKMPQSDDSDRE